MKKEILRKYFHGLTDEQFEEKVSNYPLNNVFGAMEEYAEAKAGQHETIVNGTRYTEKEFLARAVRNAIPRGTQDGVLIEECPKWVAVRDAFGCGSGYAHALCREFNLAPGKIVKRPGH